MNDNSQRVVVQEEEEKEEEEVDEEVAVPPWSEVDLPASVIGQYPH